MLEQGFARCGELLWHWTVNPKDFSDRRRTLRIRGVFVGVDVARAKPTFANILVVAQHQPGTKVVKVDLRDGVAVQVPPRAADCPVDHCPGA